MAAIVFTDAAGTWKLHNGKPYPADRFALWTPDSVPTGESKHRQSDGALTMFRFRDDFAVTFELPYIPSARSSNLVLQPENFGTTWTASGTPTRTPAAHTATGITLDLIGDDSGAAIEYYLQNIGFTGNAVKAVSAFCKKGTSPAASGSLIALVDVTAGGTPRLTATVTFDANGVPVVAISPGVYLGYELWGGGVCRLLFQTTSVTAANTNELTVRPAGTLAEQGNLYAGGVQAEDAPIPTPYLHTTTATRTGVSMHEIADRLKYHLLNGGTCAVFTNDAVGSSYATCGLKPNTVPQIVLDQRTMEFKLQLALLNVAGSPARMLARYGDGV